MKSNRFTKRASGLCLALIAGFFILCSTSISYGQTIDQQADCFTLTVTTTAACGGACEGNDCDNCATFTFTNISTNCDITTFMITSVPGPGGISASTCYSTCSPQGPPDDQNCNGNTKTYYGTYPPNTSNGTPNTFTICHTGSGAKYFRLTASGVKFNPGGIDDCCTTNAIVHF